MTALGLGRAPTARRAQLLDHCRHMVALSGGKPVGFAAFEIVNADFLVHEISVVGNNDEVLSQLIGALELACLAAGAHRLFIARRTAVPAACFESFGYRETGWGQWLEKTVP